MYFNCINSIVLFMVISFLCVSNVSSQFFFNFDKELIYGYVDRDTGKASPLIYVQNYTNTYGNVFRFDLNMIMGPGVIPGAGYTIQAVIFDDRNQYMGMVTQTWPKEENENEYNFNPDISATAIVCPPKQQDSGTVSSFFSIYFMGTMGAQYLMQMSQQSALLYTPYLDKQLERGDISQEAWDRAYNNTLYPHKVSNNFIETLWFDLTEDYIQDLNSIDVKIFTQSDTKNRDYEGLFWISLDDHNTTTHGRSDNCPNMESMRVSNNRTSRLTFRRSAVFNLNRDSRPPLKAGRYYIGVTMETIVEYDRWERSQTVMAMGLPYDAVYDDNKHFYVNIVPVNKVDMGQWVAYLVFVPLGVYMIVILLLLACELITNRTKVSNKRSCTQLYRQWFINDPNNPNRIYSYGWTMAIVICAFFISSFQFIWAQRTLMRETGNRDICFYNDNCYRPTELFDLPMNNLLSNFAYITAGISYNIFVALNEWLTQSERGATIFYALGWCLLGEGVFSAMYHMCPQPAVYQFDTACMYAIAIIGALSVYQIHEVYSHSQLHYYKSAKIILFVYIPILLINYIGVWSKTTGLGLLIVLLIIWITYITYRTSQSLGWEEFKKNHCIGLALFIGYILIFLFPIYLVMGENESVANAILYLLIAFMLIVLITMVIKRKIWSKSSIGLRIILITLNTLGFGAFFAGLYFFKQKNTSEKSAASASISRNENKDCFNAFMDWHDLWHVLSALGLFFFALLFYYVNTPHLQDNTLPSATSGKYSVKPTTVVQVKNVEQKQSKESE